MRAQRHQAQLAGRYGATPFNIRDIALVGQGLALRIGAHALRAAERELPRRIQILARRLSAQNAMHGPAIGRGSDAASGQPPLAECLLGAPGGLVQRACRRRFNVQFAVGLASENSRSKRAISGSTSLSSAIFRRTLS